MTELLNIAELEDSIAFARELLSRMHRPDDLACTACETIYDGLEDGDAFCHCDEVDFPDQAPDDIPF